MKTTFLSFLKIALGHHLIYLMLQIAFLQQIRGRFLQLVESSSVFAGDGHADLVNDFNPEEILPLVLGLYLSRLRDTASVTHRDSCNSSEEKGDESYHT